MRVLLAKRIGFCFGVRRAIEMAEAALGRYRKAYSLGPIIHNTQVVERLARKGLRPIGDAGAVRQGAVVISSHGISPRRAAAIRSQGLTVIDTTCPFVSKAQALARSLSKAGYTVIIVGEKGHPEVRALVDFVSGPVHVVRDERQAARLRLGRSAKVSIISQTTQSVGRFLGVAAVIRKKRPREVKVVNTICQDVRQRQAAAEALAREVDAIFIVGGRHSANTKRLYDICRRVCGRSYCIETEREIRAGQLTGAMTVGLASGASTPDWMVRRVVNKVRQEVKKNKYK